MRGKLLFILILLLIYIPIIYFHPIYEEVVFDKNGIASINKEFVLGIKTTKKLKIDNNFILTYRTKTKVNGKHSSRIQKLYFLDIMQNNKHYEPFIYRNCYENTFEDHCDNYVNYKIESFYNDFYNRNVQQYKIVGEANAEDFKFFMIIYTIVAAILILWLFFDKNKTPLGDTSEKSTSSIKSDFINEDYTKKETLYMQTHFSKRDYNKINNQANMAIALIIIFFIALLWFMLFPHYWL